MRIEKLRELGYHLLADLAHQRYEEYCERRSLLSKYIHPYESVSVGNFVWAETPEGQDFWSDLSRDSVSSRQLSMKRRPDLFVIGSITNESEDKKYTITTNGLFKVK